MTAGEPDALLVRSVGQPNAPERSRLSFEHHPTRQDPNSPVVIATMLAITTSWMSSTIGNSGRRAGGRGQHGRSRTSAAKATDARSWHTHGGNELNRHAAPRWEETPAR
ncbi:MAG: hypothetical protein K0V04_33920 [Deltaproteobacteria bacterium]|nr:hypothetical protein [Deltaproteobacteria bacterium]